MVKAMRKLVKIITALFVATLLLGSAANVSAASSTKVSTWNRYHKAYSSRKNTKMTMLKYKKANGKYFKSVHTPAFGTKFYTYNQKVDRLNGKIYWYADDANLDDSMYLDDWQSKLEDLKYKHEAAKDDMAYYQEMLNYTSYDDYDYDYWSDKYLASIDKEYQTWEKWFDFKGSTKYYVKTSMKVTKNKKGHISIKATKKKYHGGKVKKSTKTFTAYIHN